MKIILYLWEIRRTEWERITLKEANVKKNPIHHKHNPVILYHQKFSMS